MSTSKSNAVAERPQSAVPALANTPAVEIDASDIALPRLYRGDYQSNAVKERLVDLGCLYLATGKDDPDPTTLWTPGKDDEGVLFHVLGMYKGKSRQRPGEEFQSWAFNDPEAPADADVTYNYTLALPEWEDGAEVPVRTTISRTSTPAARLINTLIKRNEGRKPAYGLAFRMTTRKMEKGDYKWYTFVARQVDAKDEHVEMAATLAQMIGGSSLDRASASTGDEPSI